jgi:dTDP-4-amino-4,6-dideoxygalactose transaminase
MTEEAMTDKHSKLAIDGGAPVRSGPIAPWPFYAEDEIETVVSILKSGQVNQWTGTTVQEFEAAMVENFESPYAIAVANGSLAIELALKAYDIGPGDDVIVTPRSFMASVSSVDMVGARPVFADVDINTQNLTPETIRAALTPDTKAIIPVHLGGLACDMAGIMALAAEKGLIVIEDCAQAHGTCIDGKSAGSFGHASAWSFCQDKIITTGGEGGATLFSDQEHWSRAWSYKDHGKNHYTVFKKNHPAGFRWLHETIGTNWRLTAMQAGIGLRQLEKLPEWTRARNANASRFISVFNDYKSIVVPKVPDNEVHAYYRLTARVEPSALAEGWSRDRIMAALVAEGVPTFSGACAAIYKEKAYSNLGGIQPFCAVAERLGELSLAFQVHPTLDQTYLDRVETALRKVLDKATA